ncbi:MAG: adenosyl-hopene transferase HpnH [Ectothiorhodospiraceae bacterium]|nr:adenosyl-hopene transferase HpnH [Chromatiales bacterium]MCP5155706.1 adenosyl-hopene transferase HpnH [Ectothiorhodospiraceae bacterium]
MGVPLRQQFKVGLYVLGKRLRGERRYPLVLMLEPLFKCNLACAGCGKIDYPDHVLDRRMSVEEALGAVDECGAPVVSIAGGEPLIHKEMPSIVEGMIARGKFVYLCTNALLLGKRMKDYRPSPYLTFSVHLDGNRDRHDASVCQGGVFDRVVEVIRQARERGFRVTVNCTLFQGEAPEEVADFLDHMMSLGVEGVTIAPGFSYERAPQREVFLQRRGSKQLFREVFAIGRARRRRWRLNHSSLYLDFLAGNQAYQCTAWGNPTRNVFGWQKPCYLLVGEGYAPSFRALMDDTEWSAYGVGRNPKCADCMVHCGFEPTAVNDAVTNPLKALWVRLRGPRTSGPMAPEPEVLYPTGPTLAATAEPGADGAEKARAGSRRVA